MKNNGNIILFWYRPETIYAQFFDENGTSLGVPVILLQENYFYSSYSISSIALENGGFTLAFLSTEITNSISVGVRRFSDDLTTNGSDFFVVCSGNRLNMAELGNGQGFWLISSDGDQCQSKSYDYNGVNLNSYFPSITGCIDQLVYFLNDSTQISAIISSSPPSIFIIFNNNQSNHSKTIFKKESQKMTAFTKLSNSDNLLLVWATDLNLIMARILPISCLTNNSCVLECSEYNSLGSCVNCSEGFFLDQNYFFPHDSLVPQNLNQNPDLFL